MQQQSSTRYAVILPTARHGDLLTNHHWNRAGAVKEAKAFARIGKQAEIVEMTQEELRARGKAA